MRAVLKAQINKTDRNDARGIAQMMRAGLYRPVHVKTLRSQKLRMLLTHRKHAMSWPSSRNCRHAWSASRLALRPLLVAGTQGDRPYSAFDAAGLRKSLRQTPEERCR